VQISSANATHRDPDANLARAGHRILTLTEGERALCNRR
jgi:hypothetical protein